MRVYLDGTLVFNRGRFSARGSKNLYDRSGIAFFRASGPVTIGIEVENHLNRTGGIASPLYLGNPLKIEAIWNRRMVFEGMLVGMLLVFFFFNIFIGLQNRSFPSALSFGLMILFMLLRILSSGEALLAGLLPWMSSVVLLKIEYATVPAIGMAALHYLHQIYHIRNRFKVLQRSYNVLSLVMIGLTLILPPVIFTRLIAVIWLYILLTAVYAVIFILSFGKYLPGFTKVLGFSSLGFLICVFLDIAYSAGLISVGFWSGWGFTLMIAAQMFHLISRYQAQINAIRELSMHMEETVQIRTRELSEQNIELEDELEKQKELESHLRESADTAPLTGTANRIKFNRELERRLRDNIDKALQFTLILADIDHFKSINDRFGHPEGDRVIVDFCRVISKQLRPGDILARWGGEEFAIILNVRTVREAREVAERLRSGIEREIRLPDGEPLTASFGVTIAMKGDGNLSIIERADQALYRSKRGGRNLVSFFTLDG